MYIPCEPVFFLSPQKVCSFFLVKFGFFFHLQRFALSSLCEGCRILHVHNKIDPSQLFSPTSRTNSSNYSVTELLKRSIHSLVVGLSAPSPSRFTFFSMSSLSPGLSAYLACLSVQPCQPVERLRRTTGYPTSIEPF